MDFSVEKFKMNISNKEIIMNTDLLLKKPISSIQVINKETYTFDIINKYFFNIFYNKTTITMNEISIILNILQKEHIYVYDTNKINIDCVNNLKIEDIIHIYTCHEILE